MLLNNRKRGRLATVPQFLLHAGHVACFPTSHRVSPAPQALANIKGLSEAKIEKMVECAKKLLPGAGWQTGADVLQKVRWDRSLFQRSSCILPRS